MVEKKGSEDATIIEQDDSSEHKRTVEVQMKSENSELDMMKLIEWLLHFQTRSSNNNLLHRLVNERNNFALFITNARCSDSTSTLVGKFPKIFPITF